ncbi:ribbon-helix-helix protein, CopG family [Gimesia alba]|nr:ribbon-helix-helix protein, CopG family [Gimesia alba]
MPKKIPNKVRINLELPKAVKDRVERLRKASEAESMSEVIRFSIAVYELLWSAQKDGSDIVIRNPDGTESELHLLPMSVDHRK